MLSLQLAIGKRNHNWTPQTETQLEMKHRLATLRVNQERPPTHPPTPNRLRNQRMLPGVCRGQCGHPLEIVTSGDRSNQTWVKPMQETLRLLFRVGRRPRRLCGRLN